MVKVKKAKKTTYWGTETRITAPVALNSYAASQSYAGKVHQELLKQPLLHLDIQPDCFKEYPDCGLLSLIILNVIYWNPQMKC
jgi:hypothetical protein